MSKGGRKNQVNYTGSPGVDAEMEERECSRLSEKPTTKVAEAQEWLCRRQHREGRSTRGEPASYALEKKLKRADYLGKKGEMTESGTEAAQGASSIEAIKKELDYLGERGIQKGNDRALFRRAFGKDKGNPGTKRAGHPMKGDGDCWEAHEKGRKIQIDKKKKKGGGKRVDLRPGREQHSSP